MQSIIVKNQKKEKTDDVLCTLVKYSKLGVIKEQSSLKKHYNHVLNSLGTMIIMSAGFVLIHPPVTHKFHITGCINSVAAATTTTTKVIENNCCIIWKS